MMQRSDGFPNKPMIVLSFSRHKHRSINSFCFNFNVWHSVSIIMRAHIVNINNYYLTVFIDKLIVRSKGLAMSLGNVFCDGIVMSLINNAISKINSMCQCSLKETNSFG